MSDPGHVFSALFAASPDGLLLVDEQGLIRLANPTVSQLLGYAHEDLIGAPVEMLVPDSIRPRHAAYRQAYERAPRSRPMGGTATELVARRRDGSEVLVEIALSPLQPLGLPYTMASIRSVAARVSKPSRSPAPPPSESMPSLRCQPSPPLIPTSPARRA